jgi:hypothetical protein
MTSIGVIRSRSQLLLSPLVLAVALAACAVDADDDEVEGPGLDGVEAVEVCTAPISVPPLSEPVWSLANHENRTTNVSNYGTDACASYTVGMRNLEWLTVTGTGLPSDADGCERTRLSIRKYRKGESGYDYVGSRSASGEINEFGACDLSITYDEHEPIDILRYSITASKTTCSGMFCYTSYGRPLNITARGYDP